MRNHAFAALMFSVALGCASGCTSSAPGVEVRAIKSASDRIKGGDNALGEAQGLLNLGNPGLALEAFRKIQREQPSAEALAGIAACYSAMGRDDLARANLEAALAFAPASTQLLESVAVVMDRQGDKAEATLARAQAEVLAPTPTPLPTQSNSVIQTPVSAPVTPTISAPAKTLAPVAVAEASAPNADDIKRAIEAARRLVEARRLTASVTVKLPPARPAETVSDQAPRLERLSPGEVALVTTERPYWAPMDLQRTTVAVADARWTPLNPGTNDPNVRLLNAARIHGLADAARAGLVERGWRRIEIGDNAEVLATSVVYYPADKRRIGRSLAAHFGIAAKERAGGVVTILLGRDVADHIRG